MLKNSGIYFLGAGDTLRNLLTDMCCHKELSSKTADTFDKHARASSAVAVPKYDHAGTSCTCRHADRPASKHLFSVLLASLQRQETGIEVCRTYDEKKSTESRLCWFYSRPILCYGAVEHRRTRNLIEHSFAACNRNAGRFTIKQLTGRRCMNIVSKPQNTRLSIEKAILLLAKPSARFLVLLIHVSRLKQTRPEENVPIIRDPDRRQGISSYLQFKVRRTFRITFLDSAHQPATDLARQMSGGQVPRHAGRQYSSTDAVRSRTGVLQSAGKVSRAREGRLCLSLALNDAQCKGARAGACQRHKARTDCPPRASPGCLSRHPGSV